MGISTITVTEYDCDCCRQVISASDLYQAQRMIMWSDGRDVTATAKISVEPVVPYAPEPYAICKRCAARLMREAANQLAPSAAG